MNKEEINKRFDKLYKTLGYKDELPFEEIPPEIQLKQFIHQEIERAVEEERVNTAERIMSNCSVKKEFRPCGECRLVFSDILSLITKDK